MSGEIVVQVRTPISLEDLETVAAGLEAACGGGSRVIVTEMFEVAVTDPRQAAALRILFPASPFVPEKPKTRKYTKRVRPAPAAPAPLRNFPAPEWPADADEGANA